MKDKFILELYNNDILISREKMKSYRQIEEKTGIAYHNCRSINLICTGKMIKKFVHPTLKDLMKKVKIIDDPDYLFNI
jgi:hypothetical protein